MQETRKQRLVGLMVLTALAVIFLPSLFHRDEPVVIDTTSLIPPSPVVEPVVVPQPVKPEKIVPQLAPGFDTADPGPEKPDIDLQAQALSLTNKDVPKGWVLQVASLKLQESAEKLVQSLAADAYPAYWQQAATTQGELFRVLVGPYIDQQRAQQAKKQIDKAQKVDSRVLRFNPLSGD